MRNRTHFIINVASGWLAQAAAIGTGILLLAYCFRRLDKEHFGVFQLATSIPVLLTFLQLGMGPTLIRFCSKAISERDDITLKIIGSSGHLIMGGLGAISALLLCILIPAFLGFYDVPSTLRLEAIGLLLCLALSLFFNTLTLVSQGLLYGANRYDLVNGVMISGHVIRILLVFSLFELITPSIFFLGVSFLISSVVKLLALLFFSIKNVGYDVLFSMCAIRIHKIRDLARFSSLTLTNAVSSAVVFQGPVFVIGKTLGENMVAAFAPALLISRGIQSFLGQASRPLVPLASSNKTEKNGASLGQWAVQMATFSAILGLIAPLFLIIAGRELIVLWIGDDFAWIWPIVAIMSTGTVLGQSQAPNYFLALGAASIRPTVVSQAVLAAVLLTGTIVGTGWYEWDLLVVSIFWAICVSVRSCLVLAYAYSRQFRYGYVKYVSRVYLVPITIASACIVLGLLVKTALSAHGIIGVFTALSLTGLTYSALMWHCALSKNMTIMIKASCSAVLKNVCRWCLADK